MFLVKGVVLCKNIIGRTVTASNGKSDSVYKLDWEISQFKCIIMKEENIL